MLRLNMAIPPTAQPEHVRPRRRRPGRVPQRAPVADDVVTIELRAVAGATIPLVDPSFTPDGAAALHHGRHQLEQQLLPFLASFPYLGTPVSGYDSVPPDVA